MVMVSLLAVFVLIPSDIFLAKDCITQSRRVDSAKFAQWYVDIHFDIQCETDLNFTLCRIDCHYVATLPIATLGGILDGIPVPGQVGRKWRILQGQSLILNRK